jgi:formamidopyrimidine-DNA glycosylase
MSGQVRIVSPSEPLAAHTHVRLRLGDGNELRFVDPRTFGELFVSDDLDERRVPKVLSALGLDPLVDEITASALFGRLRRRHVSLKSFLLDQSEICGIGNIYADEICFDAKLSPLRRTDTLRRVDVERLVASMHSVLDAAVLAKGSSLKDARYRDVSGGLGSYQDQHATYDREGLPCPSCGRPIRRGKVIGRSTYFCPKCQH